jgi:hypothetical protein
MFNSDKLSKLYKEAKKKASPPASLNLSDGGTKDYGSRLLITPKNKINKLSLKQCK